MEPNFKCKYCNFNVTANDFFCPNCGKELKAKPLNTGIGKQVWIYLLSAILPPLGLWPGIKYLRQKESKSKIIGVVAIIITIISTLVSFWIFFEVMDQVTNQLNTQLNQLSY